MNTLLIRAFALSLALQSPEPVPTASVGRRILIEQQVLPGPELEVKPLRDRDAPLVLRIVDVYPHGTAFRYDLEAYALEPGQYDLRNYLKRKDGSSSADLPPIPISVQAILPPGQVEPHALKLDEVSGLGGYRLLIALGGFVWIAGLGLILLAGRKRHLARLANRPRPLSMAERLRPLVESAMDGSLPDNKLAELERLLIGYWTHRLALDDQPPARAIALLRDHDHAGPLLRQLETWLHQPPDVRQPVDVSALLEPYRDLPGTRESEAPAEPHASNQTTKTPGEPVA